MPTETDPLAEQLRTAAEAISPPFSPDLHATIMRAVRHEKAVGSAMPARPAIAGRIVAAVLGLAAAAAVVAVVVRMAPSPTVGPKPVEYSIVKMMPQLPSWSATVTAVSNPIARQLTDARRDYVDHGAGRFARYCLDQLDVLPAPRHGQPATNAATDDVDRS